MITAGDLRKGITFEYEGKIYVVVEFLHVKPGKGAAFVRTKLKNIVTGQVIEKTFNPVEKFEKAHIERKEMVYLYNDGDLYYFMDNETYEQVELDESKLEWEKKFLREEQLVEITYYNEEILGISLPAKVTLRITKCEPGVRGDTARAAQKDAELETGLTIRVPLFIEEGEEVIVRTDTGDYDSRA